MTITPTQLRANLYKILDQVIETQQPIEILRNGQVLKLTIASQKSRRKMANLQAHPGTILGDAAGVDGSYRRAGDGWLKEERANLDFQGTVGISCCTDKLFRCCLSSCYTKNYEYSSDNYHSIKIRAGCSACKQEIGGSFWVRQSLLLLDIQMVACYDLQRKLSELVRK